MNILVAFFVAVGVALTIARAKTIEMRTSGAITSLDLATTNATSGDVVLVHGGTYNAKQTIWNRFNATADRPVTIRAAPGETVVFDGTGLDMTTGNSAIITVGRVKGLVFEGPFEIKNSDRNGIVFLSVEHAMITNQHIHDTKKWAIAVSGKDITIDSNEIHDCVLENWNGSSSSWSQCVASWGIDESAGILSQTITWSNNSELLVFKYLHF